MVFQKPMLTSVFEEKKSLYYPIYNIFHASGSLFISLTARLPHASGNLEPFVTLTLRAVETTLVTINHGLTFAHSRLGLSVTLSLSRFHFRCRSHSRGVETNVGTITLCLTLAHGLGVTITVYFSLEASCIVCIFLLLHSRKNLSIFFSL